ncbi:5'-3' exonuclease H3TH domain-containing protein [Agrobacterium sp. CG674]
MSKNYLLIDGNSLGHYYNNGAQLSIGGTHVQAIYGFLRGLRSEIALYQTYSPIVLWDGASWRKMMFPTYKEIRDREETKAEIKLKAMKEGYKKQAPYIKKALRFLGIPQVSAMNMEADDLGAILTDRYSGQGGKIVLLTGDKDWLQLVGPNVSWKDPLNGRMVNATKMNKEGTKTMFEELTGVDTVEKFVQVKALCGDAGDSVPGVGGIGQKGAVDFINEYGTFSNFLNEALLGTSIDVKKLPKKFRNLVEDEEKGITFKRNIELMDLRSPARPAPFNLVVDKGDPSYVKFHQFCEVLLFKSITQELADWLRVFPAFREIESIGDLAA